VLVTVGVEPVFPETGYGYIRVGEEQSPGEMPAFRVDAFVEKPSIERAKEYCASGKYYWNSGMFIWRPSVILAAIKSYLPNLAAELEKIYQGMLSGRPDKEVRRSYAAIEPISIDFGVMEKAKNVLLIPGRGFVWSDVGSWSAWADAMIEANHPEKNNVGIGDVEMVQCENTTVFAQSKFVAAVGLSDVVIVETGDSVLVCKRECAQDVKKIVDALQARQRTELL
jgi:mannose-1-phosphate guanylyltransferase